MKHARRGFTLIELAVVLTILAIATTVILPVFNLNFGHDQQRQVGGEMLTLLSRARSMAIDSNVYVSLVMDPTTGDYRIDTVGVGGAGLAEQNTMDLSAMESMTTDATRLRYYFQPTGAAIGDTVRIQGPDSSMVLHVDPWDGKAHAGN